MFSLSPKKNDELSHHFQKVLFQRVLKDETDTRSCSQVKVVDRNSVDWGPCSTSQKGTRVLPTLVLTGPGSSSDLPA